MGTSSRARCRNMARILFSEMRELIRTEPPMVLRQRILSQFFPDRSFAKAMTGVVAVPVEVEEIDTSLSPSTQAPAPPVKPETVVVAEPETR